jgi:hypothetical protein
MSMRPLSFLLGLLPTLALAGCQGETSGGLTVTYRLGPGGQTDCADFDIQTITGRIGADGEEQAVDCGQDLVFSDLDEGGRRVYVEATDSAGFVVMDNGDNGEKVTIRAGEVVEHEAALAATPVKVYVRWSIAVTGFPAQCTDSAVDTAAFSVTAWDDLPTILAEDSFACDAPTDEDVATYRRLPDPDRSIKGNSLAEVSIQPQDGGGGSVGSPARFTLATPPGPGRMVYLTVACEDNVCTAQGTDPWDTP